MIDAPADGDFEQLRSGVADVEVVTVDAGVPGELLRMALVPLAVVPLSALASSDPRADRKGPAVRLFVKSWPAKEDADGRQDEG